MIKYPNINLIGKEAEGMYLFMTGFLHGDETRRRDRSYYRLVKSVDDNSVWVRMYKKQRDRLMSKHSNYKEYQEPIEAYTRSEMRLMFP